MNFEVLDVTKINMGNQGKYCVYFIGRFVDFFFWMPKDFNKKNDIFNSSLA